MDEAIFDAWQEEVCAVIERSGIKLNKDQHDQLYKAIRTLSKGDFSKALAKDQNGADIPDKLVFRENLGLMEAALRSVGTGENQLPDMSSFPNRFNVNGFQEFPGGLILQWGQGGTTSAGVTIQFPTSFRHQCF
ncbi:gp53-like domain-containing protein [Sodalis glossinidius]|uniref:gp53-like domain-containing protein n=1 Tax=Sodalis glossinidius TaxID=63612 RepID=UPI0002DAFFF8|nr:hypothetical protein [Sodalis glossinidius]